MLLETGAGHNRLKHLSSPSIHGLLGRFWRCCWRCRLPGSQVCQEQCSTGRHRVEMVCGGRIWQEFDCCHPCLSEGRGSYLKKRKINKLAVGFILFNKYQKKREIPMSSWCFVRCVNLIQCWGWAVRDTWLPNWVTGCNKHWPLRGPSENEHQSSGGYRGSTG